MLSEHQESSRRLAVHTVHDAGGRAAAARPDRAVGVGCGHADDGADDGIVVRLAAAEAELSAYRRALHERLDDATSELIARYREEPALALCALPLPTASDVA